MNKQIILTLVIVSVGCSTNNKGTLEAQQEITLAEEVIKPSYVTEEVNFDSDDPAIWVNPSDPSKSLILGTDKMENEQGAIFVFDLAGKIDTVINGIDRPNNIDLAYQFPLNGDTIDIAIFTERMKNRIRVISIPTMEFIDGGGIKVFEDDEFNAVMGVAIYKNPVTSKFYAIVSRKENPDQNDDYLYQYLLVEEGGVITGKLVRKFGAFEGSTEIEAIAVDNELGYIYYSDEGFGIRKYYADPAMGNDELAIFGLEGFTSDREGISIFKSTDSTGFILISDQQANAFQIFPREGEKGNEHRHPLIKSIKVQANESDGSEVTNKALNSDFPNGLFVAMSDNKTFELYSWTLFENVLSAIE